MNKHSKASRTKLTPTLQIMAVLTVWSMKTLDPPSYTIFVYIPGDSTSPTSFDRTSTDGTVSLHQMKFHLKLSMKGWFRQKIISLKRKRVVKKGKWVRRIVFCRNILILQTISIYLGKHGRRLLYRHAWKERLFLPWGSFHKRRRISKSNFLRTPLL